MGFFFSFSRFPCFTWASLHAHGGSFGWFSFFSCSFFFLPTSACDYSGFPFPLGISTSAVDVSYELGVPIRGRVSFMAITLLKTPVRFLMVTTLRLGFNLSACVINPLRMKEVAPHPSTPKIVCCCWLWR